jgi:DNA-binding transcriptional regulator YiaG
MPRLEIRIDASMIYHIRMLLRHSQEEFAAKLGVSLNIVQKWEQGKSVSPRPKNMRALFKILQRLNIDTATLLIREHRNVN